MYIVNVYKRRNNKYRMLRMRMRKSNMAVLYILGMK